MSHYAWKLLSANPKIVTEIISSVGTDHVYVTIVEGLATKPETVNQTQEIQSHIILFHLTI